VGRFQAALAHVEGLADQVDHHSGRLFGAVLLSSLITAGANLVSNSDDNGFTKDLGDAAAQQAVTISAARSSAASSTSSPPSPSARASSSTSWSTRP